MKKFLALTLAILMIFALASCTAEKKTETKTAEGGVETKKLTLATSADFPPYEFIDDDGAYAGIDIEVAQKIAEKLGMELEIVNMDFDAVVTSVSSKKYDIGMAGLTVTEERQESVDFTESYATGVQVVITKADSAIKTVDDLYADGAAYKVGVQLSTTGDIYFSGDVDDNKTTCSVQQFKSGADAVAALATGKIDCVIIDNEPAKSFVKANEGLVILDTEYVEEDYAICLAKGNTELLGKINTALKDLIADGTFQAIIDKYIPAE